MQNPVDMARKVKKLIDQGVDKREVGYYSTPEFIAKYLTEEMIDISPDGRYVLDPAVGKEELLKFFNERGKEIDSLDIIDYGCHRYSNFKLQNFMDYYHEYKSVISEPSKYDYIIANPPYNCHEVDYIKKNKTWLKSLFPVGTYNMYSMFLSAMIDIAKDGCIIGVNISDSFLTSTYHAKLREQIFSTCSIHQLILCPPSLYSSQKADVRTCILILQKGRQYQGHVKICNRIGNIEDLRNVLHERKLKKVELKSIVLKNTNQILIDVDSSVVALFDNYPMLGSMYRCVTCISTGNDARYLSSTRKTGYSVPFYKNPASRKFISREDAYLIDDYLSATKHDKNFMVRNKQLLHHEGIACSSMGLPFSAVYLPANAVSGVNPTIFPPGNDLNWLLAFLNSSLVTYLIRGVLIRTNMVTSGYVSMLPVIKFTDVEKNELSAIALEARQNLLSTKEAISKIDSVIAQKKILPERVIDKISDFCNNLMQCV